MPHYVASKYPNKFRCNIFTKQISEYICFPEVARIQIIFEGHFIQIFEHSYSSLQNLQMNIPIYSWGSVLEPEVGLVGPKTGGEWSSWKPQGWGVN